MARRNKRIRPRKEAASSEPLVNKFAAQHGDYRETTVVDLGGELGGGRQRLIKVVRNLYPSIVDRWLAEGGVGFDEPQRRAITHVRELWHRTGSQGSLVANLDGVGGGSGGRERDMPQAEALTALAQYRSRIPRMYWDVFERVVREEWGAGKAAEGFADRPADRIAHARSIVGFVASMIAQWRGF